MKSLWIVLRFLLPALALPLIGLLCIGAAHASCLDNWMDCTADSPVRINSFTQQASGVIGEITAMLLQATADLQAGKITVAQAKAIRAKCDAAKALWKQARVECAAKADGTCATQARSTRAFALLTSAEGDLQ